MTDTAETISPPRTLVAMYFAMIASGVLSVLSAALWWGYQGYLRSQFVIANNKLKPTDKNYKKNYTLDSAAVHSDVHNWLVSELVQGLLFGIALVLIALQVRRGKNWARWLLLVLLAIPLLPTATPYRLLMIGSGPAITRVGSVLVGLTGLAVVILLLLPDSTRYFSALRAQQAGGDSPAPLGLRGLFAPRGGAGAFGSRAGATAEVSPSTESDKPAPTRLTKSSRTATANAAKPAARARAASAASTANGTASATASKAAASKISASKAAASKRAKSTPRAEPDVSAAPSRPAAAARPVAAAKSRSSRSRKGS